MAWPCGPNSKRVVCRVNGHDHAHESGHASSHVNDRGRDGGHGHESAHVHENVPCCDHGGASCRLRGHATHSDLTCRAREDLH